MNFDNKIKDALNTKAENISPDDDMLFNIKNSIEKENNTMKKFSLKTTVALCAVLCAIGSVAVIGSGLVKYTESHSNVNDKIQHYPTQDELDDIIDYKPKYVEKLGKYDFDFAIPSQSSEKDDKDNTLHSYTDMSFWYKTDKGILTLNTHPSFSPSDYSYYDYKVSKYNGIKLYYNSIKYKFVPPDYELTDEDKKLQENKKLEISYGSDKVEIKNMSSVSWEENGIKYNVMDMDVGISEDEIMDMAKQVIDSGN